MERDAPRGQGRRHGPDFPPRTVDPATGRFTQEDPIGLAGGLNLYGFAIADPRQLLGSVRVVSHWTEIFFGRAGATLPLALLQISTLLDLGALLTGDLITGEARPQKLWKTLSSKARLALNKQFLDDLVARGDDVAVSVHKNAVKPGSPLEWEIEYLISKGYTWDKSGTILLAPK